MGFNPFKKVAKWAGKQYGHGPSVSGLKSSIKGTGHTVGNALDNKYTKLALATALTATGVGAPAAAALMAAEGFGGNILKKGGNIGGALKQGAVDGVSSYGAGKLLGQVGSRIPGASKVTGPLGGILNKAESVRDSLPVGVREVGTAVMRGGQMPQASSAMDEQLPPVQIGHSANGDPIFNPGQGPEGQAGQVPEQGRFRQILDFLSGHKDDILDYGAAAEAVADRNRRNKLQDKYKGLAEGEWAADQPLRDQGRALMLDQSMPDASEVFNGPQRRYRPIGVGSRLP